MNTTEFDKELKRGQIWQINSCNTTTTGCEMWADRPAIIISNDVTCAKAGFVNIVYLTTQKRKRRLPTHIDVVSGDKKAIALCEQIHTVDKKRIGFYIDTVESSVMTDIDRAIMFSLGIANTAKPSTIFKKWANAVERYDIDLTETESRLTDSDELEIKRILENGDDKLIELEGANNAIERTRMLYFLYRDLYQHEHLMRKEAESALKEIKDDIVLLEKRVHNSIDRSR